MSHSEKVCRVGSIALAPIAVALIGGVICGAFWGFVLLLERLFPGPSAPPGPHSEMIAILMGGLMASVALALFASALYPLLYAHCRGAEFFAQMEAFDKEDKAIFTEWQAKKADVARRKAELMRSQRSTNATA